MKANNAADEAVKIASKCQVAILASIMLFEPAATPENIILIQQVKVNMIFGREYVQQ